MDIEKVANRLREIIERIDANKSISKEEIFDIIDEINELKEEAFFLDIYLDDFFQLAATILKMNFDFEERKKIEDTLQSFLFASGLYNPLLFLPSLKDNKPTVPFPYREISTKRIHNLTSFFADPSFVDEYKKVFLDNQDLLPEEYERHLHSLYEQYNITEGPTHYYTSLEGKTLPFGYNIDIPDGKIEGIVIDIYGLFDSSHYNSLVSTISDNTTTSYIYNLNNLCHISLYTHEYILPTFQTVRTDAEVNAVIDAIHQFKEELYDIFPELPKEAPIYLKGASGGATVSAKYAVKYPEDFDGYILISGDLRGDVFHNLEKLELDKVDAPVHIIHNMLDGNVFVDRSVEEYVKQLFDKENAYFLLLSHWGPEEFYIEDFCAKGINIKDNKIYPMAIIQAGHGLDYMGYKSIIDLIKNDKKPNKLLGNAQALYAQLEYKDTISKFFRIYRNNFNARDVDNRDIWNLYYRNSCKVSYILDSLRDKSEMQNFIESLYVKMTDAIFSTVFKEYLKQFIYYSKIAYENKFLTEEEINSETEKLSQKDSTFYNMFLSFFKTLGNPLDDNVMKENDSFHLYSQYHIKHILELCLINFPELIEFSPAQEEEFEQYEINFRKVFKNDITCYINSLKAYVELELNSVNWQYWGSVTGVLSGTVISALLVSANVLYQWHNGTESVYIYFSKQIQNFLENLISQNTDNKMLNALCSKAFATTFCIAIITVASIAVTTSASLIILYYSTNVDYELKSYIDKTLNGIPRKIS